MREMEDSSFFLTAGFDLIASASAVSGTQAWESFLLQAGLVAIFFLSLPFLGSSTEKSAGGSSFSLTTRLDLAAFLIVTFGTLT